MFKKIAALTAEVTEIDLKQVLKFYASFCPGKTVNFASRLGGE